MHFFNDFVSTKNKIERFEDRYGEALKKILDKEMKNIKYLNIKIESLMRIIWD